MRRAIHPRHRPERRSPDRQKFAVQLDAKSQPLQVDMGGGLNFISNDDNQSMHGNAVEGTLTFGRHVHAAPRPVPQRRQLRRPASEAAQRSPRHRLRDSCRPRRSTSISRPAPILRRALRRRLGHRKCCQSTCTPSPSNGPQQLTNITGDQLARHPRQWQDAQAARRRQVNTKIVDLAADGSTNTSTGDRLQVTFTPQPRAQARSRPGGECDRDRLGIAPIPPIRKISSSKPRYRTATS